MKPALRSTAKDEPVRLVGLVLALANAILNLVAYKQEWDEQTLLMSGMIVSCAIYLAAEVTRRMVTPYHVTVNVDVDE